ncbi:MAG: hypothetical protein IRZ23_12970 [Acetobacteraceae bacterium]|nr:hypothetical protein [Acetobacteraceae bacterium]
MAQGFGTTLLGIVQSICGGHISQSVDSVSPADIGIGSIVMVLLASVAAIGTTVAALYMIVRPGERALDHPKRRILAPDR